MMGFALAGALAGLTLIAWPVCLHVMKARRHIQVVPSLRLFGMSGTRLRMFRLEKLLILIARIAIVTCLALWMAQPYLETARILPLPDEQAGDRILGAVIDDSLSALHSQGGVDRLTVSGRWLRRQIRAQPDDTRIGLAFASAPSFARIFSKPEALALLDKLTVSPRPGHMAAALKTLEGRLAGKVGECVVVAPRADYLWDPLQFDTDASHLGRLYFLDLTDWCRDVFIRSVASFPVSQPPPCLLCRLAGSPERLAAGPQRLVTDAHGLEQQQTSASSMAIQGEVPFALSPPMADSACWTVKLSSTLNHPWLYYYVDRQAVERVSQAVILRDAVPSSLKAAHIMAAVLRVTVPDIRIREATPDEPLGNSGLEANLVVIIGAGAGSVANRNWLDAQIERGTILICLPSADSADGVSKHALSVIPTWQTDGHDRQKRSPLKFLSLREAFLSTGLPESMATMFKETIFDPVIYPRPAVGLQPLVMTEWDQSLLAVSRINDRSLLWVLGFPLRLYPGGPVVNPAFPAFIQALAHANVPIRSQAPCAWVGETVDVGDWFGLDAGKGILRLPDGTERRMDERMARNSKVYLELPGIYEFQQDQDRRFRVVNYPREPGSDSFSRQEWTASRPHTQTHWLGLEDSLTVSRLPLGSTMLSGLDRHRYDLTPILAVCLVFWMGLEGVALFFKWRNSGRLHEC